MIEWKNKKLTKFLGTIIIQDQFIRQLQVQVDPADLVFPQITKVKTQSVFSVQKLFQSIKSTIFIELVVELK